MNDEDKCKSNKSYSQDDSTLTQRHCSRTLVAPVTTLLPTRTNSTDEYQVEAEGI